MHGRIKTKRIQLQKQNVEFKNFLKSKTESAYQGIIATGYDGFSIQFNEINICKAFKVECGKS